MTPEQKILAKMRKLKDQGRAPELTLGDASVAGECSENLARRALKRLHAGGFVSSQVITAASAQVWRLK